MKQYIPSLNGLRAISIIFVLYAHVLLKNFNFSENPGGQVGVTIFFIISGYLITLLLLQEEAKNGFISLKNFYIRRTLRIFPLYYILLLVYLLLQLAGVLHFTSASWITSLTYTKYLLPSNYGDWESGHLWSLSIEEHFYLVWPLIFTCLKKYRVHFACLVIIAVTLTRLFTQVSVMHLFTRADALMWGCLFAIYNKEIVVYLKSKQSLFLLVPFVILLLSLLVKRGVTLLSLTAHKGFVAAFLGSYGLVTNLCICLIIVISIHYKNNIWYQILNTRLFTYVGRLSYSIYVWQQLFFSAQVAKLLVFPINIICIFTAAVFSYHFIEKPFLALKAGFKQKTMSKVLLAGIGKVA